MGKLARACEGRSKIGCGRRFLPPAR